MSSDKVGRCAGCAKVDKFAIGVWAALMLGPIGFGASESWAQGGWAQPRAIGSSNYAVGALDTDRAVLLDSVGRVYRTEDSGANWTLRSFLPAPIYGVSFSDDTTGTAVGGSGTIVRTLDGGLTWLSQLSGTTVALIGVSFADTYNGVAVGQFGTIVTTGDGGDSWTSQISNTSLDLFGVSFLDAMNGLAVGDAGVILRTVDGGASWMPQDSGTTAHLQSVSFLDIDTAIVVGELGTILATTDGGASWIPQSSGTTSHLYGLFFVGTNTGTAVGCETTESGDCLPAETILRTVDGGAHWVSQSSDLGEPLFAVAFSNENVGTAVGEAGTILHTVDGGTTWTRQQVGPTDDLFSVSLADANNGIAIGSGCTASSPRVCQGTVFRTNDGGATWIRQFTGSAARLHAVSFPNANSATAVGDSGTILHSVDGGANWDQQSSGTTSDLESVSFVNGETGTAVGTRMILRTTDAGTTWIPQSFQPPNPYFDIWSVALADVQTGCVFGATQGHLPYCSPLHSPCYAVLRTTDGGATWRDAMFNSGIDFASFANSTMGAGVYGLCELTVCRTAIRGTTDGGATWTTQFFASWALPLPTDVFTLRGVVRVDSNTEIAVGTGGKVMRTDDGGANWTTQTSGTNIGLFGVSFADPNTGVIVGGQEIILWTTTGGE